MKPKSKSRKPATEGRPVVAAKATPEPQITKPVTKVAPKAAVTRPIVTTPAAPKGNMPVAKAEPLPVVEPLVEAAAVSVEWPVTDTAEPVTESDVKIANPDPAVVAAVPPVATVIKKGPLIMTDMLETAKTYTEEAKTRFQSVFAEANEKTKAAVEKSSKAFEEIGELTKGNLEAIVESSKIAAKGVESLGQDAAEFGRRSFEKTSATMKSFAAVKSPAEFFQLQSELLSATFDSFASEASKNSEAFLKLAGEISTPISNRVSIVTEKMKALAA